MYSSDSCLNSTISYKWRLLLIFTITCVTFSRALRVFTALETRRSPHQKWILHSNDNLQSTTPVFDIDKSDHNAFRLPSLELRDEPHVKNQYNTPRNVDSPWKYQSYQSVTYPYDPYPTVTNYQSELHRPFSNYYNSFPPWYADKYRRMPRDDSDVPGNVIGRLPWNYKPRCRSCGRPMLQDSFCSDDFVLRVYIYKSQTNTFGELEYTVYIYDVYKDVKRQLRPTHYIQITYNCDRFHTGPILGQVYLITGLYVNGIPTVDSCSWKAPWTEVTRQQKRYLGNKYRIFCGICKIQRVLRRNPQHHRRSDTCYVALTPNPNEMVCRDRFSVCRYKRQTRRCGFNTRTPYDICKKWLSQN